MELRRFFENAVLAGLGAGAGEAFLNSVNQLGQKPPEHHLVAVGLGVIVVGGVFRTGVDILRRPAATPKVQPTVGKTIGEIDQSLSAHQGDVVHSSLSRLSGLKTIDPKTKRKL